MTQTNTNKTKQQLEQEKRQNARKVSNLYTHDIVKEFSQHMEERNANFFSLPKDELVRKFEEFIQEEYDDNILEALKDGKVS